MNNNNNKTNLETKLYNKLKPLYSELLKHATDDHCTFCMQWGSNFPSNEREGILFVGRAVNGWQTDENTVESIFDSSETERVFNRPNQMKWAEDEGYVSKSAFWRVIKGTTQLLYPDAVWYTKVAWSNICKLAPYDEGNPSETQYWDHLNDNKEILNAEIETLSPKCIVFLTKMSWVKPFYNEIEKDTVHPIATNEWGNGYIASLYKIGANHIIISEHPMRKNESTHIEAIYELINLIEDF